VLFEPRGLLGIFDRIMRRGAAKARKTPVPE
jgi:hypothetical protein